MNELFPQPDEAADVIALRPNWREYERRKQRLRVLNLTPDEYSRQCRRIADELGI
jgi:hypothetical protein